jgi:DNA-binding NarL/FixJ family response regulator
MPPEHEEAIRVLVVDDHAVVRRGLLAFLDSEPDLEVVGDADGGAAALETMRQLDSAGRRPHVVVMDLQMEPVDGIETTRRIREGYGDVEVVVLTSFGEEERVHAALRAGASGFLLKDADADEVAVAVRAAHRGEVQLDAAIAGRLTASLRSGAPDDAGNDLTSRERQVLRLLGAGEANKQIAADLGISERTARTHVSNILSKLHLNSRTQAALWAAREGLVAPAAEQDLPRPSDRQRLP